MQLSWQGKERKRMESSMVSRGPQRQKRSSVKGKSTGGKKQGVSSRDAVPGLVVPSAEQLSRESRAQEARWRAESDLRTLREAEQIRSDQKRLRNATQLAAAEVSALQAIRKRNGSKA
ncbi:MAG: hypothetical protein ACI9IO_001779 [Cyanobium sp.]|jgi:hypothetical protein